ncbi:MAG TPA: TIGR04290 family methyltransferase [Polyangiaceae bacterium]|nr:TIGR04290 family methyltransferase [Polyangiaceae bacterium]
MTQPHDEIAGLGPWFHNLHLPDGTETAPGHELGDFPSFKWRAIAPHFPERMEGTRVLDIGCNAGFYSIELARRGALVTAIDVDDHYLAQARWAATRFDVQDRIEFRNMQVYELAHVEEQWDVVLFLGVFYHLRYPLLGLDVVSRRVGRTLVFQSMTMPGPPQEMLVPEDISLEERERLTEDGWPKMAFIEQSLAGDRTNWWAPNAAAVAAMLRTAGLRIVRQPAHEIYWCEPDPDGASSVWSWNAEEYLAATGCGAR